jgi:hypothetical protein
MIQCCAPIPYDWLGVIIVDESRCKGDTRRKRNVRNT